MPRFNCPRCLIWKTAPGNVLHCPACGLAMHWHHDLADVNRWYRLKYRAWDLEARLALVSGILLVALCALGAIICWIVKALQ